eukprot:CAMPEP_0116893698 /NCGR_PEP_ID=MMETSP0467-20121206/3634_1 /TAXON_ID=283647 /ORGANISM="Mesodinium pulex, Strain SPMC105" /LENGTH=100 /DNA_ID=CAMNT_0004563513 /DNA_START=529 /DNA_END=831 /DNA_ORIENTATION=+
MSGSNSVHTERVSVCPYSEEMLSKMESSKDQEKGREEKYANEGGDLEQLGLDVADCGRTSSLADNEHLLNLNENGNMQKSVMKMPTKEELIAQYDFSHPI